MTEPYQFRNPDGTLRLDEMLGERCVRHYTRILASSNEQFSAMQLAMATADYPEPDAPAAAYAWQEPARGTMTGDGWLVSAEGASEREASSCTAVSTLPSYVWDVCGYYRRLGIAGFLGIYRLTRTQLRLAYLERDPRQEDGRLFYALAQLTDELIRRAYDLMPLGGLFLGDREVREMIERKAAMEASRRNAQAFFDDEDTDQAQVLKEWGFDKGISEEEARSRLSAAPFRAGHASDELGSTLEGWERDWGWYRLTDPFGDGCDEPCDPGRLEQWQAMIAAALSAAGVRMSFAVGTWPGNGTRYWRNSNESCIFFIGKGQLCQEMANEAVSRYLARR